jgi:PiT family inorganic phosphate transporter
MFSLLGGVFLGWSLGANDASNVFGSAVASRMLKFWTAAILASVFVLIGAIWQGQAGIETLKGLTQFTLEQAVVSSVAAATTVTIMTILGLPVSTSQAVIGAVLGVGIVKGISTVSGRTLVNIIIAWILTPAIAGFFATAMEFTIHLQYVPNP